jgi:hypothetical protein
MSGPSGHHRYMADETGASVLDTFPTQRVPGLNPWKKSVSHIEPDLRVRAIVHRTHRALVGDPNLDLVTALLKAANEVAPGNERADWSALRMIAGKKESAIDHRGDRITGNTVRRLRLSYVELGKATLRADEALRREAESQRTINVWAMEILRCARDLDPADPLLEGRGPSTSPVLERLRRIADRMRISTEGDGPRSRAVDLLRPVAVAMGRAPDGVSWTQPLDDALSTQQANTGEPGSTIFDQAIEIAADENTRLSLILRALPKRPTRRDRIRAQIQTRRALPRQVKVAPAQLI